MKNSRFAAIALLTSLLAAALAPAVKAEESPWVVRVRATHIAPADKSDPVGGTGSANRLSVSSKTIPELDISWFATPHIAAELILTYPQKHTVSLDGKAIGTFKHLPPTLLAQYHFAPRAVFSPYVGVGINLTRISSVRLLNNSGSLERSSAGLALQAGADVKLEGPWHFNLDVKKVQLRSDVGISGTKVSAVQVDPLLFSLGLGHRF